MKLPSFASTAAFVFFGGALAVGCSSAGTTTADVIPDSGTTSSGSGGATRDGGGSIADAAAGHPYDAGAAADAPPSSTSDSAQPEADGGSPAPGEGPYGADGPSTVTTATLQVPAPSGTFTTTAYIPSGDGAHPVVVLSSGFFQDGVAYAPYASRLASWGILTFTRDDPNLSETTPNVVADVEYTVSTWLAATNADATSALQGKVDVTRVGLAGHSRGGQVALLAGEGLTGKIQGVFGLDPVDSSMGSDPEARTTLGTIGVPLAFIGETTDAASSGCAPAADNFLVLYQAASSPAVAITAIDADHTMFEDPSSCSFCTLCTAGTASQPVILATAVRYLTAFFARQLLGDASVGAAFEGAGAAQDVATGTTQLESK
jgi:dienelactone hydrolase